MRIAEIMTGEVITVDSDATLIRVGELMLQFDIGMLPVTEDGEIVGTVTDRDVAVRGVADGLGPEAPVQDVMTPDVIFCYADQAVEDAAHIMKEERVRRLLVLNRNGEPVGVVSLGDIALATADRNLGAEILVAVTKGEA